MTVETSARLQPTPPKQMRPSTARIMTASLVGTAIEFYDFYIFGTAAALALGQIFFPSRSPNAQTLAAFATFGIAFLARPIGSALFGHFGDRYGRKSTLVSSLLLMGISTTLIGALPGYAAVGLWAPVALCFLRLAQGVGLGGEWGGAALLAVENAPAGWRIFDGQERGAAPFTAKTNALCETQKTERNGRP